MGRHTVAPLGSALLLVALWVPFITLNRFLAVTRLPGLAQLGGLVLLPILLVASGLVTLAFILGSRWWCDAPLLRLGRLSLPRPGGWAALSGVAAALLLIAVPLSFTFAGVSIAFIQLLMRGDVLLIAPLVDRLAGRRVRPMSWVALGLVLVAIGIGIGGHRLGAMPPLCLATIGLYTLGYFLRLFAMSRAAKTNAAAPLHSFFVGEQIVATPLALLLVGLIGWIGPGQLRAPIQSGFGAMLHALALPGPVLAGLVLAGALSGLVGIATAWVLLGPRENLFCVCLERSASVLGGLLAAALLAAWTGAAPPRPSEWLASALLIGAICCLTLAAKPRAMAVTARHIA